MASLSGFGGPTVLTTSSDGESRIGLRSAHIESGKSGISASSKHKSQIGNESTNNFPAPTANRVRKYLASSPKSNISTERSLPSRQVSQVSVDPSANRQQNLILCRSTTRPTSHQSHRKHVTAIHGSDHHLRTSTRAAGNWARTIDTLHAR
jgi:hypothetical protein